MMLSSRKMKTYARFKNRFIDNGRFRFWMRGYDDLGIYSERQFRIKLEYIHNNPLKAGLVGRAEDYVFSSARDWIDGSTGLITVDKSVF